MATEFTLSAEKIEAARERHYYIKVSTGSHLFLTGHENIWKKNSDYVYVPSHRVVGTEEEVDSALRAYGATPDEVATSLLDGYRPDNEDNRTAFDEDLAACRAYREEQNKNKPVRPVMDYSRISNLIASAGNLSLVDRSSLSRDKLEQVGGNRVDSIQVQLENLPEGKYLDVSKMRPNGSNIVKCDPPVINKRTKRFNVDGYPIVCTNEANLVLALQFLGKNPKEIEALVDSWKNNALRAKEAPALPVAVEASVVSKKSPRASGKKVAAVVPAAKPAAARVPKTKAALVPAPEIVEPEEQAPKPAGKRSPSKAKAAAPKVPASVPKLARKASPPKLTQVSGGAPPQPPVAKRANLRQIKA